MANTDDEWSVLSKDKILDVVRQFVTVPHAVAARKSVLLEFVHAHENADIKEQLTSCVRQFERQSRLQQNRLGGLERCLPREEYCDDEFLRVPNESEMLDNFRRFYQATSNAAVKSVVCGICAREVYIAEEDVKEVFVDEIPNRRRLAPIVAHPQHVLVNGMLLEPAGICEGAGGRKVRICSSCWHDLCRESSLPPPFSLANNMWIGDIPECLQCLSYPEQLLIARVFTRVYVFKLQTKNGFNSDPALLQRGMKGGVCTYDLPMDNVCTMLRGQLMPQRLDILPALIVITYIGTSSISKRSLYKLFRVRRSRVLDALGWLRINNPKYYGDIVMDSSRISALPEDDVPLELVSVVHQTGEEGNLEEEDNGYVPSDNLDGNCESINRDESEECGDISATEAGIIPLQVNGVVDTDMTRVSGSDLMLWATKNMNIPNEEPAYGIRHGNQPVPDFPSNVDADEGREDSNYFEKAFPCLFPYGVGGIESRRSVSVSFAADIRRCLSFWDRRFRRHETFPFVAFGISQRRQTLLSARLRMRHIDFEREGRLLASITMDKLRQAAEEESRGEPISDPAVRSLRQIVHTVSAKVKGSNQARIQTRTQLRSMSIMLNPPSLWITINPSDIHNPIAQVFAGEDIDLDNFVAAVRPPIEVRVKNIASDPYAAAKFFHFLIEAVLEHLIGVKVSNFQVKNRVGIFGRVSGFFGAVESQGRGTLHFHLLLWLAHAPSSQQMAKLLKEETFRERVKNFIHYNLRAYLPGLESAESVKAFPRQKEVGFCRPPNPDSQEFQHQFATMEFQLARSEQIHTCKLHGCLLPSKDGGYFCKRRAPFPLSDVDGIDENGKWVQVRKYGYVNGWVPSLLVCLACNVDGKLLSNARATLKTTGYVGNYSLKKQDRHFNFSAIMVKGFAMHLTRLENINNRDVEDARDKQRLLLFRLVHSLNREQELAGPMVISYLMNWNDIYRSHQFVPIFWSQFHRYLLQKCSDIEQVESDGHSGNLVHTRTQDAFQLPGVVSTVDLLDTVSIEFNAAGELYSKSQVTDYIARGHDVENMNVLDYFTETYESPIRPQDRMMGNSFTSITHRGRPRHVRVRYQVEHPKYDTHVRIRREKGHNTFPNFIGKSLPYKFEGEEINDRYCASMLMLLKPWRALEMLKQEGQSWVDAWNEFEGTGNHRIQCLIRGIQYDGECRHATAEKDSDEHVANEQSDYDQDNERERDEMENEEMDMGSGLPSITLLEAIQDMIDSQTGLNELVHGRSAIEIAKLSGLFKDVTSSWSTTFLPAASPATGNDIANLYHWQQIMEEEAKQQKTSHIASHVTSTTSEGDINLITDIYLRSPEVEVDSAPLTESSQNIHGEEALQPVDVSCLNNDQRRAYNLVMWHLDCTLMGQQPPSLQLIIHGQGGTGKSQLIQSITAGFQQRNASSRLIKAAYTGIAASLIQGKTTHAIAGLNISNTYNAVCNDECKLKLETFWGRFQYLIIDEMSMISKDFLALLSRNISIGKKSMPGESFGGLNVILVGDFYQFPPVARSKKSALYYPINMGNNDLQSQIGRKIFEEFQDVIILKDQMRVVDDVWQRFLERLRNGCTTDEDIAMLRDLLITRKPSGDEDELSAEWTQNMSLVTPRHAVREQWNDISLQAMAKNRHEQIFVCMAEDTCNGQALTATEKYNVESHLAGKQKNRRHFLSSRIQLAIGMKVMVTNNLETDLDITNGARGEITKIILHPEESSHTNTANSFITLQHLPVYIIIKLDHTRTKQIPGLDVGEIPIVPCKTTM